LRRNQRNSRARKQAYIQDLEQRWGKCVQLGAQATVEMQQAARKVQDENRLLRGVIRKLGLDEKALERALDAERLAESKEAKIQVGCLLQRARASWTHYSRLQFRTEMLQILRLALLAENPCYLII